MRLLVAALVSVLITQACGSTPPAPSSFDLPAPTGSSSAPAPSATVAASIPSPASSTGVPSASAAASAAPSANWPIVVTPGPQCDATFHDPEAVAADVYARLSQPAEVAARLRALMPCLGVPILPADVDDATLRAFLDGPYPAVLDLQLDEVAEGLSEILSGGTFVDLDSLVADLAQQGFTDRASGQALTRTALDPAIQRLAASGTSSDTLPRLLLALGRERATRLAVEPRDPVWGVADLDELQFLLFGLGLMAVGRGGSAVGGPGAAMAAVRPLAPATVPRAAEPGGGAINSLAGILGANSGASGPGTVAGWMICASAYLRRAHVIRQPVTPGAVWHRNGRDPDETVLGFQLIWSPARFPAVLRAAGCPEPSGSPSGSAGLISVSGKSVSWELDQNANKHGSLSRQTFVTDGDGHVVSLYQTVNETADRPDQIPPNLQTATAAVTVEVLDLLPGFGRTSVIKPSRTATFQVHWYEPAEYKLTVSLDFVGTNPAFYGHVRANGEFTLRPQDPPTRPGGPRLFEGRSLLSFTTIPIEVQCKFVWRGGGTVQAYALSTIYEPVNAQELVVTLPIAADTMPKDTVTATKCPPGGKRTVTSQGKLSLFLSFLTPMDQGAGAFTLVIDNWQAVALPPGATTGVIATARQTGTCGSSPRICNYSARFTLEKVK